MIIYGAILIPIFTAILLFIFFRHKTLWWEFAVPLASSFLFIIMMKLIIETSQVRCKEYWGSFIDRVEYYEDWNERVSCRHSYDCNCTTDDEGNESCSTCYEHLYDVDYHSPYWQLVTTTNEVIGISKSEYSRLMKLFGNQHFTELNRDYHTDDGDKYSSDWKRDSITAVPVTTTHSYENRVKVADQSVFHFQKVDTGDIKRFGLKEYPYIDDYTQDALIGDYTEDGKIANKKLKYINGLLGNKKQVRLFVLVFPNQPIDAGFYQEWHWSGGNMNEFVVCIGTDASRNVKWCHPISWTPAEKLKADVKQYVVSQNKLNLSSLADYMQVQVGKQFIRKDFKEFDYLTVEPPNWAIILAYILTFGLNVGLSFWIVTNEFEEGESESDDNSGMSNFQRRIEELKRKRNNWN